MLKSVARGCSQSSLPPTARITVPFVFVISAGGWEMSQVTLCRLPDFQTVPAWGYVTGGTNTSLTRRGKHAMEANRTNRAMRRIMQEFMVMRKQWCSDVKWWLNRWAMDVFLGCLPQMHRPSFYTSQDESCIGTFTTLQAATLSRKELQASYRTISRFHCKVPCWLELMR